MAKQPPHGYDPQGRPIWALNGKGQPICGGKRGPSGTCQATVRMLNGRCRLCGGKTPRGPENANYKTGEHSHEMKTRRQFVAALHGENYDRAKVLVDLLFEMAKKGDLGAIKYQLDQMYGSPQARVINEIGERAFIASVVKVTAKYLDGEKFGEWMSDLKSELSAAFD